MAPVKIEEIDLSLDFPNFDDYIEKEKTHMKFVMDGKVFNLPNLPFLLPDKLEVRRQMRAIEKDPVKRLADISFLVLTCLSRGPSVMFGKSWKLELETRNKLSGLKSKYNICAKGPMETLTLPHITVSFPDVSVKLMNKLPNMVRPITLPELCKDMVDFPPELRGSYILSILNRSSQNVISRLPGVLAAVVHYMYKEGDLLNENFKLYNKENKLSHICHFASNALNTKCFRVSEQLIAEPIISKIEIETADAWVSSFKRLYDVNITDLFRLN